MTRGCSTHGIAAVCAHSCAGCALPSECSSYVQWFGESLRRAEQSFTAFTGRPIDFEGSRIFLLSIVNAVDRGDRREIEMGKAQDFPDPLAFYGRELICENGAVRWV